MTKELSPDILDVLATAEVAANAVRLTCGRLDRKTYQAVNQALESIGGKWNRKVQAHIFDDDPSEQLETIILTGKIQPPQSFDFFPTPWSLACRITHLAEIKPDMIVLEPSAGAGALADHCAKLIGHHRVTTVEIREDLVKTLSDKGYRVWWADFLDMAAYGVPEFEPFDRVIMNPPFSKQQDIDHVTHAWQFIKPGGRLVAIMSAGVTFRSNRKTVAFRELVESVGGTIEPNPEGSFKASGTNVRTVTVVMDRAA